MEDNVWKLQDAKAQFSRVVRDALSDGPQYITRHGEPTVVVVSTETFEQLAEKKQNDDKASLSLAEYLLSISIKDDLGESSEFERIKGDLREVEL
ncbi:MAG: type II toxin-antitoxin system prevent-host-death family antitoxin [Chloroflexota bacterium]